MADFVRADLHGSRFERVDLSGAELRAVDLAGYAPPFIGVSAAYTLALVLLLGAGKIERFRRIPATVSAGR